MDERFEEGSVDERFEEGPREGALQEFLHGGPRSEEWRLWREALEGRLDALKKQRMDVAGAEAEELDKSIRELEEQINALATEEIISEYVEAEIDLSLNTMDPEE